MLIRNSDWAKDFFEQVAELGRIAEPGLENVLMEELTSPVRGVLRVFFTSASFLPPPPPKKKKGGKKLTFIFSTSQP